MWINLIKEFLQDMRKQKLRTTLTIMAITWGTFAVVALLSFGEGLGIKLLEGARGGGDQVMIFYSGQTSKPYEGLDIGRRVRFTEEDVALVRRSVPQVKHVSAQYGRSVGLRSEFGTTNTYMEGVDTGFDVMRSMITRSGGRFINNRDIEENRRVVYIGYEIARQLFPDSNPVGQQMFIDHNPFTVIGVMEEKMQMGMSNGPDSRRAIIPYTTYQQMYSQRYLGSILIRPHQPEYQEEVNARFRELMARKYKFHADDTQAIQVWDFIESERIFTQVNLGIKMFLSIVGLFTLLIAGVGVANIIYVVVKERTREIGVKKAIGARNAHIISQFVFESVFICLLGGLLGLSIAAGLIFGVKALPLDGDVATFLGNPVLAPDIMFMTTFILSIIGCVAGIFPAMKASKVDPVESLRYE
ncbi:ABC transporter permease [Balneolaceae bacterium ANBcel3]|nr:ABC transporter permease [Balneolaceae bacterium ANBcel3]